MESREPIAPERPVVTLDGASGSGKSTLARLLARRLGWHYLDSGAWYRALTWAVLREGGDPADAEQVLDTLSRKTLESDSGGAVRVDGSEPGAALRTPEVDRHVSSVADHPQVRAELNARMRAAARSAPVRGVVADGRDAGTVIFPDAPLKVFVRAGEEVRAQRRHAQSRERGLDQSLEDVRAELQRRDGRDAARGDAAPRPTERSRILDNDDLTVEEALGRLLAWAGELTPA